MRAVKSLKICTLIGSFCPKHVKILMKKYRRLSFMALKSDAKFEKKKNDSWFQNRHEEFDKFSPNHSKVQKFHIDGLFLSKVYEVWANEIQRICLSWHWTVMQNLYKPQPCGLKNDMRNWWTFIRALKVWKIVHWWTLFVKSIIVSARKCQRNCVSWHWRVMRNLKENWLVAWKMT